MKLERFEGAEESLERAARHLLRQEARHSLMLGITEQSVKHPKLFEKVPYLAAIEEGGEVIAAARRAPPHNPVISLGFTPEALLLLAEDLQELYPTLPGVLGRVDAARSFAEIWEDP
jgi:hypothetical protein